VIETVAFQQIFCNPHQTPEDNKRDCDGLNYKYDNQINNLVCYLPKFVHQSAEKAFLAQWHCIEGRGFLSYI
jgi:hypothetical protein